MKTCSTCRWYADFPDERCDNADSDRFGDRVGPEDPCGEREGLQGFRRMRAR